MGRRGFPAEIRQQALDLVASGQSVTHVARKLGVSVQVVYRWRAQAGGQSSDPPPSVSSDPQPVDDVPA